MWRGWPNRSRGSANWNGVDGALPDTSFARYCSDVNQHLEGC